MGPGQGVQRAGFIAIWVLGGIAQQLTADARAGVVNAKALWRTWVSTYWPRVPRVVRAPLFAVGSSARALYRAGQYGGRSVAIGIQNGIEEGQHRHREYLELREHPVGTSGYVYVSRRIARDRLVRADMYLMRGEQVHGDAIREREERNQWARSGTLAELGEVTARWAEGEVKFHPNGYDEGPAPETDELVPALAALNRSGFVTSGSQPGIGPVVGYDGNVWWQRAAVDGYTDKATADRLEAACAEAGLIVIRNGPAKWRTTWKNSVPVTASPVEVGAGPPDSDDLPHYVHTHFGTHLSRRAVKFDFDGYGTRALLTAEQVTIIDPVWGRRDHLWDTIAGDAHQPTVDANDDGRGAESPHPDGLDAPMLTAGPPDESEATGGEHPRYDIGVSRRWDGEPETPAEKRFFDLRESGYDGWIDRDGYPAACPSCGDVDCAKGLTEHWQERNSEEVPPYPTDDDGFPLDHVTYQVHTMPDDTYDWGCMKSGCYNGIHEYPTRETAEDAARQHESEHGFSRDNNGGSPAMTTAHTCEFSSIPQLQQEYTQLRQTAAESQDELAAYAARQADDAALFNAQATELDALAAAWDAKAGQLAAAEHDGQTCSDAAATAEALRTLAQAARENAERCAATAEQAQITATAAESVTAAADRGAVDIQNNLSGLMEQANTVQAKAPLHHYASQ